MKTPYFNIEEFIKDAERENNVTEPKEAAREIVRLFGSVINSAYEAGYADGKAERKEV